VTTCCSLVAGIGYPIGSSRIAAAVFAGHSGYVLEKKKW